MLKQKCYYYTSEQSAKSYFKALACVNQATRYEPFPNAGRVTEKADAFPQTGTRIVASKIAAPLLA